MYWSHLSTPPCNWFCPHGDRCNAWAKGQKASSRVQSLAWLESLILLMPRPQYTVDYLKMEVWHWKRTECFWPKYAEGIWKHNNHRSSICVWRKPRDYREAIVYEKLRFRDGLVSTRRSSCVIGDSRQPSCVIGDSRPPRCVHPRIFLPNLNLLKYILRAMRSFLPFCPRSPRIAKKIVVQLSWWEGDCSFCRRLARALREVPLSK